MNKIIAFAGFAGSGKSTAAQAFIEQGYKSVAFADALKDVVAVVFNLDRQLLEGDTPEKREWRNQVLPYWDSFLATDQQVTPRFLLQYVGTEMFRAHWSNIWVLAAEARIKAHLDAGYKVVVPDLRFINEWEMLKGMGAHIVGIHRKSPSWVGPFYKYMEQIIPEGPGARPADVSVQEMISHAVVCHILVEKKVHRSEWEHLLIPHYDLIIHNSGNNIKRFQRLVYLAAS